MGKLLAHMGVSVATSEFPAANYAFQAHTISDAVAPYELVKTMRASILTLGPTLARTGFAKISLPGGCANRRASRGSAFERSGKMGATIATSHGYIEARAPKGGRLKGAHIVFEKNHGHRHGKYFDGCGCLRRRKQSWKIPHASPK